MTLTFGLNSVRDLFTKLQRDSDALDEEVISDGLFNFVVTSYSMIDWLKNDPAVPASAKADIVISDLRKDKWLKVYGDLAICQQTFQAQTACACNLFGYNLTRLRHRPLRQRQLWSWGRKH